MRDEATTRLHLAMKAGGFDMDCAKFWCGQVGQIDRLKYDKFYRDQDTYATSTTGRTVPEHHQQLATRSESSRQREPGATPGIFGTQEES